MVVNPEQLVDKATSEYLVQMDWTTCLEICDILNKESTHARSVVRQILKRLKEKSRVVLLALELSDSLIQNCECTHAYFGDRTFLTEVNKIVMSKKTKENVKDKALELSEVWGKAFQTRSDLPAFYENFKFLQKSGYKFPPPRPDAPKINFNQKRASQPIMPTQGAYNYYPGSNGIQQYQQPIQQYQQPTPQQQQRYSMPPASTNGNTGSNGNKPTNVPLSQEINAIKGNVTVLQEMVSFLNVEAEDPSQNELLKELVENCKKSNIKIKEQIESGSISERDFGPVLSLNDEITRALNEYEQALKKRQAFVENGYRPVQLPVKQPQVSFNKHKELEEIDFFKAPDAPILNSFIQNYQPPQQQQNNYNPFAPQNQQPQPQQNNYNPFAPQNQQPQQQQQFNLPNTVKSLPNASYGIQPQQQQQNPFQNNNNPYGMNNVVNNSNNSNGKLDDFDLFVSSRHGNNSNTNSLNNNLSPIKSNGNGFVSSSQPIPPFNNQPQYNQQSPLKPTAPSLNNTNPFQNNNNAFNSTNNNTNYSSLGNSNPNSFNTPPPFNNSSNNNFNALVPSNGGSYPNYNALDPFSVQLQQQLQNQNQNNQYQPKPFQPNGFAPQSMYPNINTPPQPYNGLSLQPSIYPPPYSPNQNNF